jgi:methionyl aminopeptidase
VLSVDCGAIVDGYYGDSAVTFPVGEVSDAAASLLAATRQALEAGIAQCVPGNHLHDVSAAVQAVAEGAGFGVVREYVGHGIGRAMHEDPQVPNYGRPGTGPVLTAGMVLAIEPMVNAGGWEVRSLDDGWTVVTADGSLSAHFEHTVAVTESGPRILTLE